MPPDSVLRFAWPADAAGWVLLIVALASIGLVPRVWPRLQAVPLPAWIAAWAVFAAVASAAYIVLYLRGGPRIIDATSYWLAARGLADGTPSWEVMAPTASFRGRFLLSSLHDGHLSVGVIFPPGYPTVLALGFLLRAPMAVGPLLGAALVMVTALLARHVTGHPDGARIAAVISSLNACLRYHTADTMSHGLAALCLVGAVLFAVRGSCRVRPAAAAACWTVAGFLAAWLLLTRPASAIALVAVGLPVVTYGALRRRTAAPLWALAGAAPALVWLAIHQHAVTGSWWQLSQTAYYLLADGPAGCFRYGFGEGIGCRLEHGFYVESVLPDGYGLRAALRTTGRRLHLHLADVMNCAPFAVL
ncbi:MAG: hypothetical protein MUF54_07475, partial [Polyangiaceae bacterium]|nr:hypothetical protein [Polyangiaceae bacterium]